MKTENNNFESGRSVLWWMIELLRARLEIKLTREIRRIIRDKGMHVKPRAYWFDFVGEIEFTLRKLRDKVPD